eukprot:1994190-Pyramimonas_sp.AAC.1
MVAQPLPRPTSSASLMTTHSHPAPSEADAQCAPDMTSARCAPKAHLTCHVDERKGEWGKGGAMVATTE